MATGEHWDSEGRSLQRGDKVLYLEARESLLAGLPESDQAAIRAQVGKEMTVAGFDDHGHVQLEFLEAVDEYISHTIWVEPDCLQKIE